MQPFKAILVDIWMRGDKEEVIQKNLECQKIKRVVFSIRILNSNNLKKNIIVFAAKLQRQ